MILNKSQKQAIKSLLNDSRFDVILKLYEETLDKWGKESGVGFNEFDTLKLTFIREGKIIGLRGFFELLDSQGLEGADEQ